MTQDRRPTRCILPLVQHVTRTLALAISSNVTNSQKVILKRRKKTPRTRAWSNFGVWPAPGARETFTKVRREAPQLWEGLPGPRDRPDPKHRSSPGPGSGFVELLFQITTGYDHFYLHGLEHPVVTDFDFALAVPRPPQSASRDLAHSGPNHEAYGKGFDMGPV